MKKIVMLVALVAFMAMSVVAFAADLVGPEGELTVTPMMKSDKKPAVQFKHEAHTAIACKDCHHTWDGKDKPKKCSECHTGRKSGEKINNKVALHKSCKDCHKDMKKAGKDTGPTSCKACHKK